MTDRKSKSEVTVNDTSVWKNRIVSSGVKTADQFMPHPNNVRLHPEFQRQAVAASLDTLGWIAPVIESVSGYLIDGHERLWQALKTNADVPYIVVDLTDDEEKQALLTFDYITSLAVYDREQLDALLQQVNSDDARVQALLEGLEHRFMIPNDGDWSDAFGGLPTGDRAPFQQMTFTLHDEQVEQINRAITLAKGMGEFVDSANENSNGNALSRICEMFVTDHG